MRYERVGKGYLSDKRREFHAAEFLSKNSISNSFGFLQNDGFPITVPAYSRLVFFFL